MTSLLPPVQSVLELFKGPLSSVRFADIDAAGLVNLAAEVETAASEVQRHEANLAELRQALAQRQEALLVLAQRALAYARVYAEDDELLLEQLNGISLPRAQKPRKAGATKTAGARAADRSESTAEVAAEAGASAERVDSEAEVAAESVVAAPLRTGRKTRGSVPQRASN
jgi:hypothetical protein